MTRIGIASSGAVTSSVAITFIAANAMFPRSVRTAR